MCEEPFWQSANLWWPEDRSWCVATEIDFTWTYVGGDTAVVQELVEDRTIEAIPDPPWHHVRLRPAESTTTVVASSVAISPITHTIRYRQLLLAQQVDDLILNTLGAIIGWLGWRVLLGHFQNLKEDS
jgi:hypothetical protein